MTTRTDDVDESEAESRFDDLYKVRRVAVFSSIFMWQGACIVSLSVNPNWPWYWIIGQFYGMKHIVMEYQGLEQASIPSDNKLRISRLQYFCVRAIPFKLMS